MGRIILFAFVGQALVFQVLTANLHPALQQYLLAGLTQPTTSLSYPSVAFTKQSAPHGIQPLAALASLLTQPAVATVKPPTVSPSPNSFLAAISDHSSPNLQSLATLAALLSAPPKSQPTSSPSNLLTALSSESSSSNVDASLLNNLAIALQLLLVSNIINNPPQETTPEPVVVPGYPIHEFKESVAPVSVSYSNSHQPTHVTEAPMPTTPQYSNYEHGMPHSGYNHYENHYPQMPNANFVGTSSFADSNPFGGTIPPASSASSSRGGFSLMSPYEALSPSSPYLDPILSSPFGSVMTSKKDFQSPYSAIMAADNKDLFSMSDFF